MAVALIILLLLALLFGPQLWVSWVMQRHHRPRDDFPGTGAEFARHLINRLQLTGVSVEQTPRGDHYDPRSKTVRLTPDKFDGKTLTAITVAAHEVGHALQDAMGYRLLKHREILIRLSTVIQQFGNALIIGIPLITAATRSPVSGMLLLAAAVASFGAAALVHLVTLPVELDASFKRALPILEAGRYLDPPDRKAARQILRAAAFTYVAASLASLLNLWRWLRLLRR